MDEEEIMLRHYSMVRKIAREMSDAADGAFKIYGDGHKMDEPSITGRIAGAIENRIKGMKFNGVLWDAPPLDPKDEKRYRVLWDAPSLASKDEKRYGADLMGVLDIHLCDYKVKKGFLAQAKKAEPKSRFDSRGWRRLVDQCEKMLECTPESFVFIYSRNRGIRTLPAVSVLGSTSKDLFDLYHHSLQNFFERHLQCYIGDRRLNSPSVDTLRRLDILPARNVLHLTARVAE